MPATGLRNSRSARSLFSCSPPTGFIGTFESTNTTTVASFDRTKLLLGSSVRIGSFCFAQRIPYTFCNRLPMGFVYLTHADESS